MFWITKTGKHDFRLFKESRVRWAKGTNVLTDSGYTGIQKIIENWPKILQKLTEA